MIDYIDLLMGEVFLGDLNNAYLYVGEDREAQQLAMGSFIRRVDEEGQQLTHVLAPLGKVVVNGTQRFMFVHKDQSDCTTRGMSFNRIFLDVSNADSRVHVKRNRFPHLVYTDGDFV